MTFLTLKVKYLVEEISMRLAKEWEDPDLDLDLDPDSWSLNLPVNSLHTESILLDEVNALAHDDWELDAVMALAALHSHFQRHAKYTALLTLNLPCI